jgi:hypothetical protein
MLVGNKNSVFVDKQSAIFLIPPSFLASCDFLPF